MLVFIVFRYKMVDSYNIDNCINDGVKICNLNLLSEKLYCFREKSWKYR